MSLVRLLGFSRLPCGCVVGRYRDVGRRREVVYVEEKGPACTAQGHRRNQTVRPARPEPSPVALEIARAS